LRIAQRGIGANDIALAALIGTEVEGGFLVREKDFQALDRELKQLRDHAKRLVGKRLVIEAGRLVTAYHATRSKEQRLLRDARESRPCLKNRLSLLGPFDDLLDGSGLTRIVL
jgi:hypothetical protein